MLCLMLPFYYNIKTSNKHFTLSDIFIHPERSASSCSISVEKRSLLICFKNCLQCSAIRYFSLWGSAPRPPHQSSYIETLICCICPQSTYSFEINQKNLFS